MKQTLAFIRPPAKNNTHELIMRQQFYPYPQLPSVCPNNFATYLLRIKDQDNKVVYTDGPHVMSWTASGSRVTMTIRQSGLTRNAKYSAELNVGTSGGQVSTTFNIGNNDCSSL